MARFTDVASVRAAGYTSIGDASTGYEHFVHFGFLNDGYLMDPDRIESIVFQVNPDGSKVIVSAMYILRQGMTMADVPDIAGPAHDVARPPGPLLEPRRVRQPDRGRHQAPGRRVPAGQPVRGTPPMLHVWVVDHPCGPFAGIETDGAQGPHGTSCLHDSHYVANSRRERSRSGPVWPRVRGLCASWGR